MTSSRSLRRSTTWPCSTRSTTSSRRYEAQDAWLQQTGRESWSDELALIVAEHHRLSGYGSTRPHAPLVEAVRRADLIDVSQGLIRFGIPSSYVKEVRATFDAGVFFKRVIPSGTLRAIRKLQQPGFLRPGNALLRSGHQGSIAKAGNALFNSRLNGGGALRSAT